MSEHKQLDRACQFAIPLFTVGGYALTGLKHPEWGLVVSLIAQPFWLYSSHRAFKEAGQSGLFATSIVMTLVILFGITNYWL